MFPINTMFYFNESTISGGKRMSTPINSDEADGIS